MATTTNSTRHSRCSTGTLLFRWIRLSVTLSTLTLPLPAFSAFAAWTGNTLEGNVECKWRQGFGTFDYLLRDQFKHQLRLVELAHFNDVVERLVKGQSGTLMGDLDYTLRAWPNHHRALVSLMRYTQLKGAPPEKGYPPFECYVQRAIHFSSKDAVPRLLYGVYLHKLGYREKALQQYQEAEKLNPNNPDLHYNFGLLLVSLKKYEEAESHARKAYQAGYPLPGLKRQLSKLGYWKEQ